MELNKIYQGDCLEVLKRLNIDYEKIIFVSDPPFNIGYKYNSYKDNKKEEDYYNWLKEIFGDNKQVIINYPESLYKYAINSEICPDRVVSWVYNSNTAKQHRDIFFFNITPDFKKVGQEYKNPTDKRIAKRIAEGKKARLYDWWNINQVKNVSKKHNHPCEMPLKVMENIVGLLPSEYIIIDPFSGTGTTGVACKNLNRNCILIEQDEKYCQIASERTGFEIITPTR